MSPASFKGPPLRHVDGTGGGSVWVGSGSLAGTGVGVKWAGVAR